MSLAQVSWCLIIAAGLVAAYFGFVPLLLCGGLRCRADVTILPFDAVETPPPPALERHFQESDTGLIALGFRPLGSFAMIDTMQAWNSVGTHSVFRLYVDEVRCNTAMACGVYCVATEGDTRIEFRFVEFVSRFPGGPTHLIQTCDSGEAGSCGRVSGTLTVRFPHIDDLVQLYRLHEALVQGHQASHRRILSVMEKHAGNAVSYIRAFVRESYEEQETIGYLRRDDLQAAWRPTIKGIYLMAWRQMWPIRQFIEAHIRKEAFRLQRELEQQMGYNESHPHNP